jgi:predicted MFS family arabinose efflux permease
LLTGIYFFAFGVFQLPLGVLLDRYGPRRVNATLLLVAAAGGVWFALGQTAFQLTAARALIGLGVSGCLMASFSAFALWYPPERLATMNGIAFASGMLGAVFATVPLEMALRVLHWREVFGGIVALTVLVSLVLLFVVPERAAGQKGDNLASQWRGLAQIARDGAFWRAALCIGASQLAAVSLSTLWVATWLRDVAGYSQAEVARALLLFSVAMMFGYVGFGRAADAMARRGRSTLPLLTGGVAVASVCLALIMAGVRTGMVALWTVFHGGRAVVFAVLAPLSEGDGRAGQHGAQRLRVCGHVQRAMGGRAAAQPMAADGHGLRARGLHLGARHAVAGAVRRPCLAVVGPAPVRYAAVKMSL